MSEHGRDFAYSRIRRSCATPNEDWSGCPIWRGDAVVSEGKKHDSLTNFSIGEAHSTWETRFLIDDHSSSTHCLQFRVALAKERHELFRWQSDKLKRVVHFVTLLHLRRRLTDRE